MKSGVVCNVADIVYDIYTYKIEEIPSFRWENVQQFCGIVAAMKVLCPKMQSYEKEELFIPAFPKDDFCLLHGEKFNIP